MKRPRRKAKRRPYTWLLFASRSLEIRKGLESADAFYCRGQFDKGRNELVNASDRLVELFAWLDEVQPGGNG